MWPPRARNAAQNAMRKGLNTARILRGWQKLPGTKRFPGRDAPERIDVRKRLARRR
jgi:hypothetical protein